MLNRAILQFDVASLVGRKRYIHMCDVCCGSNLCNSKSCAEVKRMYASLSLFGFANIPAFEAGIETFLMLILY